MSSTSARPKNLGKAEQSVMDCVWSKGPLSADDCRLALRKTWPMKESTMRTVLRRLEDKGYVTHTIEGRTYIYAAAEAPGAVATRTIRHLIDRFWGGSAEELVIGLVDHAVLSPKQLERLAKRIASEEKKKP
jgi:BlaI family transcriptional regulator, penicillinase repressor